MICRQPACILGRSGLGVSRESLLELEDWDKTMNWGRQVRRRKYVGSTGDVGRVER